MTALILALNPSIDAEWRVSEVQWEEKNNVLSERRWAGGKGINVARWLKHLGGKPQLLLPLGGPTGDELAGYLRREKIPTRIIPLREATRVNAIITTDEGRQMRFNPAGPRLSIGESHNIFQQVETLLRKAKLLILSGSLPRGLAADTYQRLILLGRKHGVRTLLDCEGPALAAAVKALPFLVKPNEHELAAWWGKSLRTEPQVRRAAAALSEATGGWVLVSRGSDRSLLINVRETFLKFAAPRRVNPRNTVGAGDALLAAVAHKIQQDAPPPEWLKEGLATGTAATQLLPGHLPVAR